MRKVLLNGKSSEVRFALVDDEDFRVLNALKWHFANGYAAKSPSTLMHRLIMKAPKNYDVDHINHDGLDNRKENLRICTHQQNTRNRVKKCKSSSIYKGVVRRQRRLGKMWRAEFSFNGKTKTIGHFKTERAAALAYNEKIKEVYGNFAVLNQVN